MECRPFWKAAFWNSSWVLLRTPLVYNTDAHQAIERLDIGNWAPGPSSEADDNAPDAGVDIVKSMEKARAKSVAAKDAAIAEANANQMARLDIVRLVAAGGTCAGASMVPIGGQLLCAAGALSVLAQLKSVTDYPPAWNGAMENGGGALSDSSNSVEDAFRVAQKRADDLAEMGAGHPQYAGAAKDTWEEWNSFVVDATFFSKDITLEISDRAAEENEALQYAQAYRILHHVESLCDRPADPLPFDDAGSVSSVLNSLSSSGSGTLWARAWEWNAKLEIAIAQIEDERREMQNRAEDRLKKAEETMSDLAHAKWSDEYELPARTLDDEIFASSWDALGTYNARARGAQDAFLRAKAAATAARNIRQARRPLWPVRSMLLDANVSTDADLAIMRASSLLADMELSAEEEREKARESMLALELKIAGGASIEQPEAFKSAREALARANKQLDDGEREEGRRVGEKYLHYKKAADEAEYGLRLLSVDEEKGAYLGEMKRLLEEFRIRLTWARELEVDVSEFRADYENYQAEIQRGSPKEESIENMRAQIRALNLRLAEGLMWQEAQYQELESLSQALLPYYPSALEQWRIDMKVWRSADDEWSDQALKNPAGLRSALETAQKRLWQQRGEALESALCENARWSPRHVGVQTAGMQTDLGGIWSSYNPISIGQSGALEVICQFDWAFAGPEIANRSDWVRSASAYDGQLRLSLSGIGAGDEIMLDIRSMQTPASFGTQSCVASADTGALLVRSKHRLRVSGSLEKVQARVPWTSTLPLGFAKIVDADGNSIEGEFVDVTGDYGERPLAVIFMIDWPAKDSQWESVMQSAQAPSMTRESFSAKPAEAGAVDVSYVLNVQGLPVCDEAIIYVEESADTLTMLKVKASNTGSETEIVQMPLPNHPQWAVRTSALPSSGRLLLAVSYRINDSAQWVELTAPLLEDRARSQNDEAALALVETARTRAVAADWSGAVDALEKARKMLDEKETDNVLPTEADRFNLTLAQAGEMHQRLTNLSAIVRSSDLRPDWAVEALEWRTQLQTMLDEAGSTALGASRPSVKSMRSAMDKISIKSLELAEKDYFALNNELNSLRMLDSAQQEGGMIETERSLLAVRESIQAEQGLKALGRLAQTHNLMQIYKAVLRERMIQSAQSQKQQARTILEQAALTQEELDLYMKALSQLDSAGSHAFQPALSLTAAKSLQTELKKAVLPNMDSALSEDLKVAAKSVAAQQSQIETAQAALARVQKPLGEGAKSLQEGANRSSRLVQSYLGEIAARPKLAQTEQAAALQADYVNMQDMMASGQWPEAIVAGESIQLRAKRLVDSDKGAAGEPPYAVIGLTLLLVIGIGFIMLRKKPPKPKAHAISEPKTLARGATA